MAEVTRVFRSKGLGYEGLEHALKEFEWDAAAFFAAPVELSRTRKINGGQHIEFTFTKANDMAIFGDKPKPEGQGLLGLKKLVERHKAKSSEYKQRAISVEEKQNRVYAEGDARFARVEQGLDALDKDLAQLDGIDAELTNNPPE